MDEQPGAGGGGEGAQAQAPPPTAAGQNGYAPHAHAHAQEQHQAQAQVQQQQQIPPPQVQAAQGAPPPAQPPPTVVLATAGYDHTIKFWEATTGVCYRTVQYPDSQVNKLAITPDKTLLAAAGNPHVRLFDVLSSAPQPVRVLEGHTGNVTSVGFEADARWMYTGSEDGTVRLWDLRAPGCQREFVCRAAVNTVELHPSQGELISGDGAGNIRVWDLAQNACSCELVPEVDVPVSSVSVASDGSLVVAANHKGTCYVWQLSKGTGAADNGPGSTAAFDPLHKLQAHGPGSAGSPADAPPAYVLKCLLSPDVRLLATASSDKTVKLWSLDGYSFELERTLTGHTRWVWDCAFSVDACYLVTARCGLRERARERASALLHTPGVLARACSRLTQRGAMRRATAVRCSRARRALL